MQFHALKTTVEGSELAEQCLTPRRGLMRGPTNWPVIFWTVDSVDGRYYHDVHLP